ncbi:MAG: hypothetical protein ACYS0K_20950 [Planctomycetota bacterium]
MLKLLGEPGGKARWPSHLGDYKGKFKGATEIWLWVYASKTKGLDAKSMKTMSVFVNFDVRGVVRDVTRSKSN